MTSAQAIEQIDMMIDELRFKFERICERRGLSADAKVALQIQTNTEIKALQMARESLALRKHLSTATV